MVACPFQRTTQPKRTLLLLLTIIATFRTRGFGNPKLTPLSNMRPWPRSRIPAVEWRWLRGGQNHFLRHTPQGALFCATSFFDECFSLDIIPCLCSLSQFRWFSRFMYCHRSAWDWRRAWSGVAFQCAECDGYFPTWDLFACHLLEPRDRQTYLWDSKGSLNLQNSFQSPNQSKFRCI